MTSRHALALLVACAAATASAPVSAQQVWPIPLPEESEEQPAPADPNQPAPPPSDPGQPAPTAPPPGPGQEPPPADPFMDDSNFDISADVLSSYAVRQGQIGIGAGIVPSLNLTGTIQSTGGTIAPGGSGTYVLAISPQFSYFPINRVEVGGFIGPILRHRLRATTGALPWPELSVAAGAFAAFHYPVTDRVLLIATGASASGP